MSLVQDFGTFIAGLTMDTLPADVEERARICLLNGYGIGIGCHDTPYAPVARAAALSMDGVHPDGATLLGDGRKTTVAGATLANAALFHGRAQEDASGAAHFGTELLPLATALIEAKGYPLDRLLPALVAGYEIGGLLEEAYAGKTTPAGLRSSTIYGPVACAALAARLMGLPAERIAAALSLAASFTGGNLQAFADGTDEWRYQVGMVARMGLVAAELAAAGARTAPGAIEGKAGLIRTMARVEPDPDALRAKLGKDWKIHRVAFKPFPVCAFNQSPVTAALRLRERLGGADLARVTVRMNPYETGYAGMDATGPFTSISGTLMSIPFCIATTLVHGVPSMKHMTTYDDAAVNALEARVELVSDDSVPTLCCVIEVERADGTREVEDLKMTAKDYAYSWDETSALARRVGAESGVPPAAYDAIERFCRELPGGSIRTVLGAFAELDNIPAAAE
ncbi:MAG: MmgE/PrpD family protein [Alphaproteobacteria bacterium]|nr:MmgE/PrpD family protein [Alphaproteobacteria bacterium]MDX5368339.1 MmgE/PrpD family protein [Alphaproteobacteria bacterium]MDX5463134.1 MmgE/PrpD family protein [Alphaproteobacteria bacterium]